MKPETPKALNAFVEAAQRASIRAMEGRAPARRVVNSTTRNNALGEGLLNLLADHMCGTLDGEGHHGLHDQVKHSHYVA